MTFRSSVFLTSRIIVPKTSATGSARRSLTGAVLCIALALIPLVVVLTVSEGMIQGITGRLIGLSSFHVQIAQYKSYADTAENFSALMEIRDDVRSVPGVTGAWIERQGTVLAAGREGRSGAVVRAVEPSLFTENNAFRQYLTVHDGVADLSAKNAALVGKKIAETIGLSVGDTIRLISSYTNARGVTVPKVKSFTVTGIVSSGYQEIDALWVFIPLETGFDFLSTVAGQVMVGVETADPYSSDLSAITRQIQLKTPNGFGIYKWQQVNVAQYQNFSSTRVMLLFVMFLIVLVASMSISSALVMLVLERRKEIAVLKSMGASPAGITASYILTGTFAGFAGVVLGVPLGLLCAVNANGILQFFEHVINLCTKFVYIITEGNSYVPVQLLNPEYYLESIPVVIPFNQLFAVSLGTILLSVLVSVIPARNAGKEKPLEVLRKV